MGFDRRYTLVLAGWVAALLAAMLATVAAFTTPGLGAARIVALLLALGVFAGLWRHIQRTNVMLARFIEALRHNDFASRFSHRGGPSFATLATALDAAMERLQAEREGAAHDLRYRDALIDDMPVALLTVDPVAGVTLTNRTARRLFTNHSGIRPEDFAIYGATFAARLAGDTENARELVMLDLPAGPQRAILHIATLHRLRTPVRAITVQPVQGTLDAVEMVAQTDLVRVLTHELLNSLTPVISLACTAADALDAEPADQMTAKTAMATLSRRITSLQRFVQSYRSVANVPKVRLQDFAADSFATELVRLVGMEWPGARFQADIDPTITLHADPDLLAQALINLLRNAAQAAGATGAQPCVILRIARTKASGVVITVSDNGPGVPEPLRGEIFLPFYTTRADGTGIGLNLVRQIVVAHGWSVDVGRSEAGGAEFILRVRGGPASAAATGGSG